MGSILVIVLPAVCYMQETCETTELWLTLLHSYSLHGGKEVERRGEGDAGGGRENEREREREQMEKKREG